MDKSALAQRNSNLAEAFHHRPIKHVVRHALLRTIARLPMRPQRLTDTQRILLIRPDHLGDILLTTPAVHALRTALPQAEIHALVGPWSAKILAAYSEFDKVLTLPYPGFSRSIPNANLHSPYFLALRTARNLRLVGYDSALILRPDHWWGALLAFLAGIPQRIGYDFADVSPFLTDALEPKREHAVIQSLHLVEQLTGNVKREELVYHFPINAIDTAYVDGYLEGWGIKQNQAIICIHPGSGAPSKLWHEDQWAVVADTLTEQLEATIVFTGTDKELPLVKRIADQMTQPACLVAGDTNVSQLGALFARASVVLGPDSGPLHLAAATGAATVTLFGPADPVEFGPWGERDKHLVLTSDIACRPCRVLDWQGDDPANHPCVRDISLGQVLEAARRVATPPR